MPWELYDPENVVFFGGSDAGQTRYVYNFNGVDSYITLQTVNLVVGDTVEFEFIAPTSITHTSTINLVSSSGVASMFRVPCNASGKLELRGYAGTLDGNSIIDGVTDLPTDGLRHKIIANIAINSGFTTIAGFGSSPQAYFPIFNVKINDGSAYNYPINDRTFGVGAVIKNIGSGADATGVNLLESGWEEINL